MNDYRERIRDLERLASALRIVRTQGDLSPDTEEELERIQRDTDKHLECDVRLHRRSRS